LILPSLILYLAPIFSLTRPLLFAEQPQTLEDYLSEAKQLEDKQDRPERQASRAASADLSAGIRQGVRHRRGGSLSAKLAAELQVVVYCSERVLNNADRI
jgi:hypothetical protein